LTDDLAYYSKAEIAQIKVKTFWARTHLSYHDKTEAEVRTLKLAVSVLTHLVCYEAKLPILKLKVWPWQL